MLDGADNPLDAEVRVSRDNKIVEKVSYSRNGEAARVGCVDGDTLQGFIANGPIGGKFSPFTYRLPCREEKKSLFQEQLVFALRGIRFVNANYMRNDLDFMRLAAEAYAAEGNFAAAASIYSELHARTKMVEDYNHAMAFGALAVTRRMDKSAHTKALKDFGVVVSAEVEGGLIYSEPEVDTKDHLWLGQATARSLARFQEGIKHNTGRFDARTLEALAGTKYTKLMDDQAVRWGILVGEQRAIQPPNIQSKP